MVCSILNLTREYTGINDVNCYVLFINLEKQDSMEKLEEIISYARDYCELGKKIYVLGMISGNEGESRQINNTVSEVIAYLDSKLDNKSKLLQEALHIAKQYYDNQKKCRESSVNSFCVPGSLEIAYTANYIRRLEIIEGSKEKSELLKFCHSVNFLYGDKFLYYNDLKLKGNVSSNIPQKFITTSFSIENSIIQLLDPYKLKYKKIKYLRDIKTLQNGIDNGK